MGRRSASAGLALVLLALAGCGDKSAPVAKAPAATATATVPATPPPAATTPAPTTPAPAPVVPFLPRGVPTAPTQTPADPADLAVIKRWLAALQHGRIGAAADVFADGAVVINATPPLHLRNRRERVLFNRTFPCGAEAVSSSSAKGYVLVTYRLTDRVGSKCDGPGGTAFGAIKVRGNRMTEWYRLPDPPQQRPDPGAGPVV